MSDNPQLGDVAIHTYKYKGISYKEYVMYRRGQLNLASLGWHNGQGELLAQDAVIQPLLSAEVVHAQLGLSDPLLYTPRSGDVATFKTASGTLVTMTYRRSYSYQGVKVLGWFTADDRFIEEPETDPSFTLVLRDGQLQEGSN